MSDDQPTIDELAARVGPPVLRGILGVLWLANIDWKVPTDFGGVPPRCAGFCSHVQAGVEHPVAPGSHWLFEQVIVPHLALFGWIALFVEAALAATMLTGLFLRAAAAVSVVYSVMIALAVANQPAAWYWLYLLLIGLSIAVLAQAGSTKVTTPHTAAQLVIAYGVVVNIAHADAGLRGDGNASWSLFGGGQHLPDELGRSVFPGSVALGLAFIALGAAAFLVSRLGVPVRLAIGAGAVVVSALLLLTYRADGLLVGVGTRATSAVVLAALGMSLLPGQRQTTDVSTPD